MSYVLIDYASSRQKLRQLVVTKKVAPQSREGRGSHMRPKACLSLAVRGVTAIHSCKGYRESKEKADQPSLSFAFSDL